MNLNRVLILKGLRLYRVPCLGQSSCVGFVLGLFRLDKLFGWSYSFTREIYAWKDYRRKNFMYVEM